MIDCEFLEMTNGLGESVIIKRDPDGTATGTLEGEAVRTWDNFQKAYNALFRAGFRE